MNFPGVTVSIDRGVADVRLDRPEKLNALDPEMFAAIVAAGENLKEERGLRAVVVSGEGDAFCSGLDFGAFEQMTGDGGDRAEETTTTEGRMTLAQQAAWVWQDVPVPVIAAIHGYALGAGIQIALGADIRFVAPDARLSVLEIRWGLTPDMGASLILPGLVGLDVAKELTFTGRMVSGEEAGRLGLATRVTPKPWEDAVALAREIATKNPHAVRGAKKLFNQSGRVSIREQFTAERDTINSLIGSPNQVEAVSAYLERREPLFQD